MSASREWHNITPSVLSLRSEKFQSIMKLLWATMDSSARSWRQVFKVRFAA